MMINQKWTQHELLDITTFAESDPNENPWVAGKPAIVNIQVVPYSTQWNTQFNKEKNRIIRSLGDSILGLEHVGSTAIAGLMAKPIIDIDLIVSNPEAESDYIPQLEALGYKLTVREPSWYQHRMLRLNYPQINLHVFAPNCAEHIRHILFRDWLRLHQDDKLEYTESKLEAQHNVNTTQEYNAKKHYTVQAIYQKIFAALKEKSPDNN